MSCRVPQFQGCGEWEEILDPVGARLSRTQLHMLPLHSLHCCDLRASYVAAPQASSDVMSEFGECVLTTAMDMSNLRNNHQLKQDFDPSLDTAAMSGGWGCGQSQSRTVGTALYPPKFIFTLGTLWLPREDEGGTYNSTTHWDTSLPHTLISHCSKREGNSG